MQTSYKEMLPFVSLLNDNFFVESGSEQSTVSPPTDINTLVPISLITWTQSSTEGFYKTHSQVNSGCSNTIISWSCVLWGYSHITQENSTTLKSAEAASPHLRKMVLRKCQMPVPNPSWHIFKVLTSSEQCWLTTAGALALAGFKRYTGRSLVTTTASHWLW